MRWSLSPSLLPTQGGLTCRRLRTPSIVPLATLTDAGVGEEVAPHYLGCQDSQDAACAFSVRLARAWDLGCYGNPCTLWCQLRKHHGHHDHCQCRRPGRCRRALVRRANHCGRVWYDPSREANLGAKPAVANHGKSPAERPPIAAAERVWRPRSDRSARWRAHRTTRTLRWPSQHWLRSG